MKKESKRLRDYNWKEELEVVNAIPQEQNQVTASRYRRKERSTSKARVRRREKE